MRWLKLSFIPIIAALLLLVTGASPYLGVPAVYKSGVMILLGVIIAIFAIYATWSTRKRHWGLILLHLGVVLTLVGGYLDFYKENKVSFAIYVGESHLSNVVIDQRTQERHDLDFTFNVRSFSIDYYPYTYDLYKRENDQSKTPELVEKGSLKDKTVTFKKTDISINEDVFTGDTTYYFIPKSNNIPENTYIVVRARSEKFFKADFKILDEGRTIDDLLAVNHPVAYKGWKFYLISHGESQGQQYVYLTAKRAPGVPFAHTGFWLLIVGAFSFGLIQRKKK